MAKLIPQITPDEIANPSESMLAKSLISQLDTSVEAYHSFKCAEDPINGEQYSAASRASTRFRDAEDEVVIIDPANGMLLLDLKGGSLSYIEKADCWEQVLDNGRVRRMNKSPFDQSSRKMFNLLDRIKNVKPFSEMERLPFTFGYALFVPQSNNKAKSFPPGIHPDLLIDAAKSKDLKGSTKAIFDRWQKFPHPPLGSSEMEAMGKALIEHLGLLPEGSRANA